MQDASLPFTLSMTHVYDPRPRWVAGDFHCHTDHSDGALSATELLDQARAEGLDFFAITDHNTLTAYPHFGAPPPLCVIPGLEVTFKQGHYNVFGLTAPAAWQEAVTQGPIELEADAFAADLNALLAASAAQGLLNSINHPLLAPWAWRFPDVELRHIHCLEVWNDPSWPDNRVANPLAVAMWTAWLNDGHRITAVGGSDFHRPVNKLGVVKPPDRLGLPRTVVYAHALSGAAILDALRRRQVYVSMGAEVRFCATLGEQEFAMGAEIGPQRGTLELHARVEATTGRAGVARLVERGETLVDAPLHGEALTLHHAVTLDPAQPTWFRLDVLDGNGLLWALTNPIFAGPQPTPTRTRYGDFVDTATLTLLPG